MPFSAAAVGPDFNRLPPTVTLWTKPVREAILEGNDGSAGLWRPTQTLAPSTVTGFAPSPLSLRESRLPKSLRPPEARFASRSKETSGAPAAHPTVASRTDTFRQFVRLLQTEASYRTVILARSLHSVGNGVMIGAFTFLLTQVGKNNVSRSFLASAALTFIEVQIFGFTNYNSAHNSDKVAGENGRLDDAAKVARRQAYLNKLMWTVGADLIVGAGMLGVSLCLGAPWASVYALGAVLTGARLLQTFKGHVEAGLFLNLRQSDPKPQVMGMIRGQENKFRQLEVAFSATANTLASVLVQYLLFVSVPAGAPFGVAVGIAVGTAVSLSPKIYAYCNLKA